MKMRTMMVLTILTVLSCLSAGCCVGECDADTWCDGFVGTVETVIDGDTFRVYELPAAVRLMGINTPETHQSNPGDCPGSEWDDMSLEDQATYSGTCCYGAQSKSMLLSLVPVGTLVCLRNPLGGALETGDYDRYVADVYAGEEGGNYVNLKMVVGGYARAYVGKYAHPTRGELFLAMEHNAEVSGVGLWGYCAVASGSDPCE